MMLVCAIGLLSGCATNRQEVGLEYCDIAEAIYWENSQELDATPAPVTRQIVRENEKRDRFCK